MPWSYDTPPDLAIMLSRPLLTPGTEALPGVLRILAAHGLNPPERTIAQIAHVCARRARGPADVWGEVVDWLNAAGIEPDGTWAGLRGAGI